MIQRIELSEITIKEFKRDFAVNDRSGKILSVLVKLEKGINLSIITGLNEVILNVEKDGVYYPRANISSRKDLDNVLGGEIQEFDYYYFDSLLIELVSEGDFKGELALKELVILYDDMQ